jgi:hypothetical protein
MRPITPNEASDAIRRALRIARRNHTRSGAGLHAADSTHVVIGRTDDALCPSRSS